MRTIKNFLRNEEGMETLEYAMIAGLIAAAAVIVYSTGWANSLANKLNNAVNTSAS